MTLKQRTTTQNSPNTFVISNNGQLAIHSSLLVYILLVSDKAHYKCDETVQIQLHQMFEGWDRKYSLHNNSYYKILYLKNECYAILHLLKEKVTLHTYDQRDTKNQRVHTADMVPATEEPTI